MKTTRNALLAYAALAFTGCSVTQPPETIKKIEGHLCTEGDTECGNSGAGGWQGQEETPVNFAHAVLGIQNTPLEASCSGDSDHNGLCTAKFDLGDGDFVKVVCFFYPDADPICYAIHGHDD